MRGDGETRMRGGAGLLDGNFNDFAADFSIESKRAAIHLAVPAVENVFRAAAQCPCGEVKTERWNGTHGEGKR